MIPILYESSETAFVSNGLGRLHDAVSCRVYEERNGQYELDLEMPVTGEHYDDITLGRILLVTHDDTGDTQPFDIVSYSKPLDGIVTFHAVHVSYRQSQMVAQGTNINDINDAFTMLAGATPANPFTYSTDISSTAFMASADGVPRSVRQFLGGIEGSILDTYGGEYEWDMWNVILHQSRGIYRDWSIRYGVNLLQAQDDVDAQSTYTSAIPYWTGTDNTGNPVVVTGSQVDSGLASVDGRDRCVALDLTEKFETQPTTSQLETQALSMMTAGQVNTPSQTLKVDFVRLQDMPEFADIGRLLECSLCDTINVVLPYGQGTFKIVKTVWDVLSDRYEEMELGTLSTSLADALGITTSLEKLSGGGGQFTPTVVTDSGTKSSFASGTSLASLSVSKTMASGVWIVMASARYPSSSTGYRAIQITADGTGQNVSLMQTPAGGTGNVDLFTACIVEKNAAWTLDLNGRQNSGSAQNVDWYIKCVKIAELS